MVIEGTTYHEKKEMQRIFNEDGVEVSYLSHMRSIGVRTFTANQKIVDGEVSEWIIQKFETTMDGDELAAFKKNWEDNWHPMIGEPLCTVENDAIGIMENFLQGTPRFS